MTPALSAAMLFGGFAGSWPNSLKRHVNVERVRLDGDLSGHRTSNQYSFGMDYDPVNKAVFMFGGYSSGPARGDTWLLALEP